MVAIECYFTYLFLHYILQIHSSKNVAAHLYTGIAGILLFAYSLPDESFVLGFIHKIHNTHTYVSV